MTPGDETVVAPGLGCAPGWKNSMLGLFTAGLLAAGAAVGEGGARGA